ncbi:MAG: hypothetical protein IJU40_07860 [Desulfovibrionaceae bacterium]|nr:hypothetical protein [Desulfovibrionaceae bacterium]
MSQINFNNQINLSHYENNHLEPPVNNDSTSNDAVNLSHYEKNHLEPPVKHDSIPNDSTKLSHYEKNHLEPPVRRDSIPEEFNNAKPTSSSSVWKTVGRVALGVVTLGLSELGILAYRGIKAMVASCRSAPSREPRINQNQAPNSSSSLKQNKIGIPQAAPQADQINSDLASGFTGKKPWPPEYQTAVDNLITDLREQYGEKYIPQGTTIKNLMDGIHLKIDPYANRNLYVAIKNADAPLSPADLTRTIKQTLVPLLSCNIMIKKGEEIAASFGGLGGVSVSNIVANMLDQPEIKQQVSSLTNEADIQNFVDNFNLGKKLLEYRTSMENQITELRQIYGNDALPKNLDQVLELKNDTNQTVSSQLSSYSLSVEKLTPQKLTNYLQDNLVTILNQSSVEKALMEKAKEMGIPLARRSTVLLAESLLKKPENKEAMKQVNNPASLQKTIQSMGIEDLLNTQKAGIEKAYAENASKLSEELRPLFRSFLEGCCFAPSKANDTNQAINKMVARLTNWKNLEGSEEVRQPLNDYFKDEFDKDLKMLDGAPGDTDETGYTNDLYNSLLLDAHRRIYTINGQKISRDEGVAQEEIKNSFNTQLPDAKDKQFVSKIFNQRLWAHLLLVTGRGYLENGTVLADLPGGSILPAANLGEGPIMFDNKKLIDEFTLQVAPDKKTAQITATIIQNIGYGDNRGIDGFAPYYGGVKFTFNIKLNLSAHEDGQGVTEVKLAQEFINKDQMDIKAA